MILMASDSDDSRDDQLRILRLAIAEGLRSGPGRFSSIEEIKAEGRRRLEKSTSSD
jgi:Arc/MetJ-type ribon-helix-helix transcriptional regulator